LESLLNFSYDLIETQIIEELPELKSASDVYSELEGKQGEDCGAYIFYEEMFGAYVEVLLNMPDSPCRNRLLTRAFSLVDEMLESRDKDVRDLAYIGTLEWRDLWYYSRALPFLGTAARRELDQWEPNWHEAFNLDAEVEPDKEIIDLYCVREVILRELESEGIDRRHVPGNTYPHESQRFSTLRIAEHHVDAAVLLGRYSMPYLVCPHNMINCHETVLLRLAQDLVAFDGQDQNSESNACVIYPRIPLGERVWQMNHGNKKHLRYEGQLWIADIFINKGLGDPISKVLDGSENSLESQ
jgi:hypothetical protein